MEDTKLKKPSTQIADRELTKALQVAIPVILALLGFGFIGGLIVYGVVQLCEGFF